MNASQYFTLEELQYSSKAKALGLDNTAPEPIRTNLLLTAKKLDALREHLGKPIKILSGYRSVAANLAVQGAPNSYHLRGQAADIISPEYGSPYEVALAIKAYFDSHPGFLFHELIHEFTGWVHVAFPVPGELALQRVRTARKNASGKTIYVPGIFAK